MTDYVTLIGLAAGGCTTASYLPQLKKCWETGETGDLSLTMFLTLFAGVSLWLTYGIVKGDLALTVANSLSVTFLSGILYFKLGEVWGKRHAGPSA